MTDYTHHFVPNPLPLLRRAALYLPNNSYDPGYAQPVRAVNPAGTIHAGTNFSGLGHRVEPATAIPTIIELADAHVQNEHTRWTIEAVDAAGAGHAFDAYFLPWDDFGSAAEMTLPNPPLANYFFTSALSGCSVIVTNTLQAPTIYHCGIDSALWGQNNRVAAPANVPAYWRGYVNYLESVRGGGARAIIAEANKEFYVTEPGVTYAYPTNFPVGALRATTQYAVNFMNNTLNNYTSLLPTGARVAGGEADPWGVFFGVYDAGAGQWDFYLQENMLVQNAGRVLTGWFKAIRRQVNPVYTRIMTQSLPWRIRHLDVVPPVGAPVYTARNWTWNEVRDGNLWLP